MIKVGDFKNELVAVGIKLIAGIDGLDREIEYLAVQEFPFKSARVLKNTVILTTFYGFKSNDEIIEHFKWYAQVGISAIFVHNVVYSKVPEELIELVNKENIPLFYIPEDVPYYILFEKYNYLVNKERLKIKNEIEQINQRMLDALVNSKDINFIIQAIGRHLNEFIICLNNHLKVELLWTPREQSNIRNEISEIINENYEVFHEIRTTLKPKKIVSQKTLGNFNILPINNTTDFFGYLIIGQRNNELPYREIIIRNMLTTLTLDAMKKNQIKEYYKNKDIKLLERIFKDKKISGIKMEDFYFNLKNINYLLIIKPKDKSRLREYYTLTETIFKNPSNNFVWIKDNKIIALVPKVSQENISILTKEKGIHIGLSGRLKKLTVNNLKALYEQANIALHYSGVCDKSFYSWDELGIKKILYFMRNSELLKDYHVDYLQPLINYDQKHNTDLIKTLYVYLSTFFSLKDSGERLHLHPNTIKYRIKKIEDILKIKVDDKANYLELLIALEYYLYYSEIELKEKH
ncbi:PucR family transcriptional regulator [Ureibacillus sp. FSL W8-0352]|uniref:PucR family transcriptional regulator n=1 Tax=Ureibacillus sp. FSL W8-0352 TaxID=2954596 RepID=UPI0030F7319B